jgi:LEA14-like dessication related protein
MELIEQLNINNPENVSVYCKGNKLTIYISGINSSVRLTYQLEDEKLTITPHPPLQQS